MNFIPAAFAALALLAPVPAAAASQMDIRIERLRNTRGTVHLCLTANAAYFPNCGDDPRAVKRSVPATAAGSVTIGGIAPGRYALSIIHDENDNGRLDSFAGIPREGFGFSGNPAIRFGPPGFDRVLFEIGPGITRETVRMQYLL